MTTFSWPLWDIFDYINRVNSSCKSLRRINLKGNLFFLNTKKWQTSPWVPCGQFSSVAQLCLTLRDTMNCNTPGLPVHHQLPEFTQTHVHQVGDAIQPSIFCRPLLLLPPIPSSIRVFSNESALHIRWPKDWNFSFNISPSNEHPGLISFRMDWLDLPTVQGTLKSLLQHHSSKVSILRRSAFFIILLKSFAQEFWRRLPLSSLPPQ